VGASIKNSKTAQKVQKKAPMSKNYSSQKRLCKFALSLPLVIIFTSCALSLGLPGSAGLAADGDFNADEMGKLKAVEQKLFIRTYDDDTSEARIVRIEKRMFGDGDTGNVHERLAKIVEIARPFDKPKNEAPQGGGTKITTPVQRQPSAEEERQRQEDVREQARVRAMAAAAEEVNQLLAEAVSLYKAQRTNEAVDKFQQVVRLAPDNAEAYFSLGVIFESQRRYKEALDSYQRASQLNPEKRDYKEAVAIVLKKARNDDDPQKAELKALADQASEAYKRGEYFSALDLYKQLDQKAPRQAKVKYSIGIIYLALKNPVEAKESFEQAHRLDPSEPRFKEAFDRLDANLKQTEGARLAQEQAWQHPGKTVINRLPSSDGNSGGGDTSSGSHQSNTKMPPLTTSFGLILKRKNDGVEITTVGIGSRASQAGLFKGDLIKAVDGAVVESPDQINQIFGSKPNGQFQLLIQRGPKIGQIAF
jgi:tetratricopeptide (TPR) repeat protein